MPDAADPWSINYFDPPTPHVPAPSPRARAPKLLPEVDRLFQAQRNTLKVLSDLDELEHVLGHHQNPKLAAALRRLQTDAENSYRVVRSYLSEYASDNTGIN